MQDSIKAKPELNKPMTLSPIKLLLGIKINAKIPNKRTEKIDDNNIF